MELNVPKILRVAALAGLVTYLAVVAYMTFGPRPQGVDTVAWFIEKLRSPSFHGSRHDALRLIGRTRAEGYSNLLFFVPLGFLFPFALGRLSRWTVPLVAGLSVAVEAGQAVLVSHRTSSIIDVYWNTAGAVVGYLLFLGVWLVTSVGLTISSLPSHRT